ncbi:MAG: PPC domain-containing DNA-binding protein [Chthoniobacteraceae bacterium]
MKIKILNEAPERTLAAVFAPGDEVAAGLLQIATEQNLTAARLTGIGALSRVVLGYFDLEKREYREIEIDEQVEVLSLLGNFALHGAEKKVHAHIVVGKADGSAHGGHVLKGWVRPTLELLIVESPGFLARKIDEATGLPLLSI